MNALTKRQQDLIYQTIQLNGKKIVLLLDEYGDKNVSTSELNDNIFCVDEMLNIIWQINVEPTKFKQDPFTSISKDNDGVIRTKRFSGFKYIIDVENGRAEVFDWNK